MKKLFITLIVSVLFATGIQSQSIVNYTFNTDHSVVLDDLSTGSTQLIAGSSVDLASSVTDIGFSFYFMGAPYTQFSVNSNGQMRLGATVISGTGITDAALNTPFIVPISGTNTLLPTGIVQYKLLGIAPNRILIVEWIDLSIPSPVVSTDPPGAEHNPEQIRVCLHETTGVIDLKYGKVNYNSLPATVRSSFISSSNTATTVTSIGSDMISEAFGSPVSTYLMNSTNTGLLNNRTYTFTPPSLLPAPTWAATAFTAVSPTGMTLNWVNNTSVQTSNDIYVSTDAGVSYSFVTSLSKTATTYAATLSVAGTSCLWEVAAVNEGTAAYSTGNTTPDVPVVTAVDCGGSSTLTASVYSGTLLWSTGETTPSITVTAGGVYSVTQTVAGLTSVPGFVTATPVPTITGPVDPVTLLPTSLSAGTTTGQGYKTESGMTGYVWSVSNGSPFTGQGSDSITVDWQNVDGQQTVSVHYINANGCSTVTPTAVLIINYFPFTGSILPTSIPQFVDPMPHFAAGLRVNAKAGGNLIVKEVLVQQVALSTGTITSTGKIGDPLTPNAGMGNYAAYAISKDNGTTFGPAMWPAQTIEAQQGNQLTVQYKNELVGVKYSDFNILADQTLMMNGYTLTGDPLTKPYTGDIPMVVHLHGGEMPSNSDGGPTAWFMPTGNPLQGPGFTYHASSLSTYPNKQEATTLWYHPHDQGLTRINVYTGLAGYYFLRGAAEETAKLPGWSGDDKVQEVTPAGKAPTFNGAKTYLPEIELAVQDRMFNVKGELFWPVNPTNPDIHPFWTPEFFGNVMTVNGKTWPYLSVAPRKYRFRVLDGCNARFLNMWLKNLSNSTNGPKITVVGTDGGLLDAPTDLDPASGKTLFMAPGERYDVVIDFSGVPNGTVFTLMNDAAAPYPTGDPVSVGTTDRIMQFVVNGKLIAADGTSVPADKSLLAPNLRTANPMVKLTDFAGGFAPGVTPTVKRQILLNEVTGPGGPVQVLFNNSHFDAITPIPGAPVEFGGPTEMPLEGTTEVIQIINTTVDAHPIHIHLLQWQLVSRQAFNTANYMNAYNAAWALHTPSIPIWPAGLGYPGGAGSPYPYLTTNGDGAVGGNPAVGQFLTGSVIPANPEEMGWKDDIKAIPGQVSTFIVRVAPTDKPINSTQAELLLPFDPSIGPGYVWHCHIIDHEDMDMMRPLVIKPSILRYPQITAQPQPIVSCIAKAETFTVTATSDTQINYKWQVSTNLGVDWTDLSNSSPYSGVLTNALTIDPINASLSTYRYRALLTNVDGTTTSNPAILTVDPDVPASVTISANENNVYSGESVIITPVPVGGGTSPTYEWYKNTLKVGTGNTYQFIPVNGDVVYVKMTSSAHCATGVPAISNSVTMTVNTATTLALNGDWSIPATWSNHTVPTINDNVVIPLGMTVNIDLADAYCHALIIEGALTSSTASHILTVGGDLILEGTLTTAANTVVLKGTVSGEGSINATSGTMVYGGVLAQTVSHIATHVVNNLTIDNKTGVTLPDALTVSSTVTINAGAKLTNHTDGNFTVKNVRINSDAISGTGTFVDDGITTTTLGGVANVQQYLTGGRNWYVSSPVTTATQGSIQTATSVYSYDEPTSAWILESSTLNVLKGYVATIGSTGIVTFSGGALNTGVPANSTLSRLGTDKTGFNLVGNPYPSYLNWDLAFSNSAHLEPTMWYRSRNASNTAYVFDTYGAISHIGTGNNGVDVTALIPPVQAFWVRVATGFASGNIGLNNTMRSHDVATNRLRAPALDNSIQQLLRLQVSNGVNSDQAIVLFNSDASNGYDAFDSEKMTNNNASVPEIYTLAGTEPVVINGLKSVSTNPELALGFTSGEVNMFTLKALEIKNFDLDTKIVLRDKMLNKDKELIVGNEYSFSSDATNTSTRFSILFKSNSVTTGNTNPENGSESIFIFRNQSNQIVVHRNDAIGEGSITVSNAIGQKLVNMSTTGTVTVVEQRMLPGVYMVTVDVLGKSTTKKITIY